MKEFTPETIRNIALIGHGGAGKTTLSEVMLYTAGKTNRIGSVLEGNTISDYSQNEIERQFSISLSLMHVEWSNAKVNIIDTPGYSDFIGEVKSGVRICDTAVSVIKAAEGIEVGTENTYHFIDEFNLPSAIIINKVDTERSNFFATAKLAKERLTSKAMVVTFPVEEGFAVNSIVDVLRMKAYTFGDASSRKVEETEIPESLKAKAEELRTELIEKIAEQNEDLMNRYLEEGSLSAEEIQTGFTEAMVSRSLTPIFVTAASKAVGVSTFLDYVVKYFPSPAQRGAVQGILKGKDAPVSVIPSVTGEPVIFLFKIISEQHVGEIALFRVYSGKVMPGVDLLNVKNNKSERMSQMYLLNGHQRKEVPQLFAGDIGGVVKLKDSHTSDTLCIKSFDVLLPAITFPEAIIHQAIIPKAKGDEDKIANCLHTLHEEDPSFSIKFDPEIAQSIIAGQGELQLSLAVKRLKERYNVDVDLSAPKIPYREAIRGSAKGVEYKHKKQTGGRGQFGHVHFDMEPLPRGTGYEFVDKIVGGVVPGRFIPAVEKGITEAMVKGVLAGCKVVDVRVSLVFGSYHDVDSDEMSFKLASIMCFKKAFLLSKPVILEPIYTIEVKIPEEMMGDVMGDASSRRGKILGMDSDGNFQIIKALVPLSELYKYSSVLRSLTAGRGSYSRSFDHYEEVPKDVEAKIIEEYKKSREEE